MEAFDGQNPAGSGGVIPILLGMRDGAFAAALRRALPGGAWRVDAAETPRAFRAALRRGPPPSFAVVDADGFGAAAPALCRELRRAEAKSGAEPAAVEAWMRQVDPEKVRAALAAGADDCRAPVEPEALALLLSARAAESTAEAAENDEVLVDAAAGVATLGGRMLPLTASGFAMLRILVSHKGEILSRGELLDELRGNQAGSVLPRSVDSLVSDLRARLGPAGWRIETAWARGYRWNDGRRPDPRGRMRRKGLPVRKLGPALGGVAIAAIAATAAWRAGRPSAEDAPAGRAVDPAVLILGPRFRAEAERNPGVDVAPPPVMGPLEPSSPPQFRFALGT